MKRANILIKNETNNVDSCLECGDIVPAENNGWLHQKQPGTTLSFWLCPVCKIIWTENERLSSAEHSLDDIKRQVRILQDNPPHLEELLKGWAQNMIPQNLDLALVALQSSKEHKDLFGWKELAGKVLSCYQKQGKRGILQRLSPYLSDEPQPLPLPTTKKTPTSPAPAYSPPSTTLHDMIRAENTLQPKLRNPDAPQTSPPSTTKPSMLSGKSSEEPTGKTKSEILKEAGESRFSMKNRYKRGLKKGKPHRQPATQKAITDTVEKKEK